jgi:hypothetical protein
MFAVLRNKTFGTFLREFSPPITSILLNAVGIDRKTQIRFEGVS